MKRQFQVDFLISRGLTPDDYLIDIGCGTLRGGLPLIDYLSPGHYTGIDPRQEALAAAREELNAAGLSKKRPTLIRSDLSDSPDLGHCVEFVWAFSVLFHLDDDRLDDCLAFVSKHLLPAGTFYANVNIGEGPQGSWREFPVVSRTLSDFEVRAGNAGLRVSDLGDLLSLGHKSGVDEQDAQRMLKFTKA